MPMFEGFVDEYSDEEPCDEPEGAFDGHGAPGGCETGSCAGARGVGTLPGPEMPGACCTTMS